MTRWLTLSIDFDTRMWSISSTILLEERRVFTIQSIMTRLLKGPEMKEQVFLDFMTLAFLQRLAIQRLQLSLNKLIRVIQLLDLKLPQSINENQTLMRGWRYTNLQILMKLLKEQILWSQGLTRKLNRWFHDQLENHQKDESFFRTNNLWRQQLVKIMIRLLNKCLKEQGQLKE